MSGHFNPYAHQRLPWHALERFLIAEHELLPPSEHWKTAGDTSTKVNLARLIGVTTRTVHRWVHAGIPWMDGDRLAVRLGVHPSAIWVEWFRCPELNDGEVPCPPSSAARRAVNA